MRDRVSRALLTQARAAIAELDTARGAIAGLESEGIPAARRAVAAAVEAQRAGKGEQISVLIARRDSAAAEARRLDFAEAAWRAYARLTELAGRLP